MSIIKLAVVKCVTALLISTIMATSLVVYAAGSKNTVTVIDSDTTTTIDTHCTTAEEILREAEVSLGDYDTVEFTLENGVGQIKINRAFPVYVTVGSETTVVNMTEGTVSEAIAKAGITLNDQYVCNLELTDVLKEKTFIDLVGVEYVTETYEESIPYTAKVEYSSALAKGKKQVSTEGKNGVRTVTVKKTLQNGVVTDTEVVSSVVTSEAVAEVTVVGTKETAKKSSSKKTSSTTMPYSSINCISTLKAPASLTLTSKNVPTSYTKKVTVEATAYTDTSGNMCSTGVKPQTGYIAVNPAVIPYGTKMFIVSADGKYVYGYAIAADTGGFIRKRPNNVDLFFDTKSECKAFGRRDVVIYFL